MPWVTASRRARKRASSSSRDSARCATRAGAPRASSRLSPCCTPRGGTTPRARSGLCSLAPDAAVGALDAPPASLAASSPATAAAAASLTPPTGRLLFEARNAGDRHGGASALVAAVDVRGVWFAQGGTSPPNAGSTVSLSSSAARWSEETRTRDGTGRSALAGTGTEGVGAASQPVGGCLRARAVSETRTWRFCIAARCRQDRMHTVCRCVASRGGRSRISVENCARKLRAGQKCPLSRNVSLVSLPLRLAVSELPRQRHYPQPPSAPQHNG